MVPAVKIGLFALVAVGAAGVIANRKLIFQSGEEKSGGKEVAKKSQTSVGGKSPKEQQQKQNNNDHANNNVVNPPQAQPRIEPQAQTPTNPTPEQGADGVGEGQRAETPAVVQKKEIDYQCKFGDDNYENSPNKKELKTFLESKGGYGLQILEDEKGKFKCAKDYENDSDLEGLKNFLESDGNANSTFNTPNTRGTSPLPIAVKKKAGATPAWTIMGPDDEDSNNEEILAPVQAPAA